ncbi:MAG: phosphatidate cytidylyltransferase [Oscillospiraceae bacterium]|nr:phosphatidate cytidylyltransferase [Oscillospiraceae bacterium]
MKTRVITAVVLLPLLLLVVLVAPKIFTAILFAAMAAIAAYELLSGTGIVKHGMLCVGTALCAFWCTLWSGLNISYAWLLLGILLFWVFLFAQMMASQMKLPFEKVTVCLVGGVILPLLFGAVVRLHNEEQGRFFILIPFVLAFLSDTGAYFAGLKFGKHKLAPVISPKKTIEGVVGGVFGAVLGMVIYCLVLEFGFDFRVNYAIAVLYGVLGSAAGVFGDLCFSVIKRQTEIKDYGNLFPGHGGILDRFDSMMVVAPLVEILMLLLPVAVK